MSNPRGCCNLKYGSYKRCRDVHDTEDLYCQSCKDSTKSANISGGHVNGKWCEDKNHCYMCCYIRHLYRKLRHYGNCCSKGRKCPLCSEGFTPGQGNPRTTVKEMYWNMLSNSRETYLPTSLWENVSLKKEEKVGLLGRISIKLFGFKL